MTEKSREELQAEVDRLSEELAENHRKLARAADVCATEFVVHDAPDEIDEQQTIRALEDVAVKHGYEPNAGNLVDWLDKRIEKVTCPEIVGGGSVDCRFMGEMRRGNLKLRKRLSSIWRQFPLVDKRTDFTILELAIMGIIKAGQKEDMEGRPAVHDSVPAEIVERWPFRITVEAWRNMLELKAVGDGSGSPDDFDGSLLVDYWIRPDGRRVDIELARFGDEATLEFRLGEKEETEEPGEFMVLCAECDSLWPPTGLDYDAGRRTELCPGCAEADDLQTVELTGTRCAECANPQFKTPSGISCQRGHSGADAKDKEPDEDR